MSILLALLAIGAILALSAGPASAKKPPKPPPEPEPLPENPDILYTSLGESRYTPSELRVMNVLGESALVLAGGRGTSWAPDGWHFAFLSGGVIYISDLEGTDPLLVTEPPGDAFYPRWSPGDVLGTGEKMAFPWGPDPLFYSDIYLVNPDGTGLVNVTNTPGDVMQLYPTWSPEASRIAVVTIQGDPYTQPSWVWSLEVLQLGFDEFGGLTVVDRRNIREEAAAAGVELPPPFYGLDWANTGEQLAATMQPTSEWLEICVLDLDPPYAVTRLTGEGTAASFAGQPIGHPTWSSDDSRVAFSVWGTQRVKGLRRKNGIYVVNSDGSGELIKLTGGAGGEQGFPEWWAGGLP